MLYFFFLRRDAPSGFELTPVEDDAAEPDSLIAEEVDESTAEGLGLLGASIAEGLALLGAAALAELVLEDLTDAIESTFEDRVLLGAAASAELAVECRAETAVEGVTVGLAAVDGVPTCAAMG